MVAHREFDGDGLIITAFPIGKTACPRRQKAANPLMNLTETLSDFLILLPAVRHSPNGRLQASYDEDANVL